MEEEDTYWRRERRRSGRVIKDERPRGFPDFISSMGGGAVFFFLASRESRAAPLAPAPTSAGACALAAHAFPSPGGGP